MRGRAALLLVVLYTAAALVATIPAVGGLSSSFIADESEARSGYGEAASGDHLQSTYHLWLLGHQLEHGGSPWRDPYSFQPLVQPQLNPSAWPFGIPFWPLDRIFGPVVAWNLLLLAGIVIAGLATAAWLRLLDVPLAAAAAGGLAFAIAPYRLAQSGGHLLGLVSVLVPATLWAFERARAARSAWVANGFGALAALLAVSPALAGQVHLALGTVVLLVVYAAVRFEARAAAWLGGGIAAAIAVGFLYQHFVIGRSVASGGRTLSEVAYYSAGWLDLISRWRRRGVEQFVYAGWLTPALALAGVVLLVRQGRRWLAVCLGLASVLPILLALGTHIPAYAWLRDVFPPLRFPRVPGRFMPIADLGLAALASIAIAAILQRVSPGRRGLAAALALVLVAADLLVFPLRSATADPGNAAYAATLQVGPGRLLEIPVLPRGLGHYGSVYQYYVIQAPRERPTGYSTVAPRSTLAFPARYSRLNCGVWLPGDRARLAGLGIRMLLFHRGVFEQASLPGAWFAWRGLEQQGYRPIAQGGSVWLFRLARGTAVQPPIPEPSRSAPVYCDGWAGRVMTGTTAWLWLYGSGPTHVAVSASPSARATITVDGRATSSVQAAATPTLLTVQLGAPAWHLLGFTSSEPGASVQIY